MTWIVAQPLKSIPLAINEYDYDVTGLTPSTI